MASILLIEDDRQIRSLLRELLEEKYEVIEAASGQGGIQQYTKTPTDMVILDILLPDMDGLETMKQLLSHDPKVKIIAISGGFPVGDIDVLKMAQRLGAQRTLAKPFNSHTLLTTVQEILQQQKLTNKDPDPPGNSQ